MGAILAAASFLDRFSDPNLAYVLFVLGAGLLVFEIFSPGGFGAVAGLLLLAGAIAIFTTLPVNVVGIVLLVAAMVLLAVEAQIPGIGVASAGAAACLILGGLYLFRSTQPPVKVSPILVVATAGVVVAFFGVVVQAVVKSRKMPVADRGLPAIGAIGMVVQDLDPRGVIQADGEQWGAVVEGGTIPEGTPIRVIGSEGLTLRVERQELKSDQGGQA